MTEVSQGSELIESPGADRGATASVYERIRQKILRNEVPPAARINIDHLARELDVSATPVREALRQLQGDNLVLQEQGRGYSTTPLLDASELGAMFEFRLLIEPWAARAAAQGRLSNPGRALEREIAELESLAGRRSDVSFELIEHDTRFHDAILASVGNRVLHMAYAQTHCHLHAFRLLPSDHTGEKTLAEHRAIARAIREEDPDAAEAAMRTHLATAYLRFAEKHDRRASASVGESVVHTRPHTRLSL